MRIIDAVIWHVVFNVSPGRDFALAGQSTKGEGGVRGGRWEVSSEVMAPRRKGK